MFQGVLQRHHESFVLFQVSVTGPLNLLMLWLPLLTVLSFVIVLYFFHLYGNVYFIVRNVFSVLLIV